MPSRPSRFVKWSCRLHACNEPTHPLGPRRMHRLQICCASQPAACDRLTQLHATWARTKDSVARTKRRRHASPAEAQRPEPGETRQSPLLRHCKRSDMDQGATASGVHLRESAKATVRVVECLRSEASAIAENFRPEDLESAVALPGGAAERQSKSRRYCLTPQPFRARRLCIQSPCLA